jgi:hypothetical protein
VVVVVVVEVVDVPGSAVVEDVDVPGSAVVEDVDVPGSAVVEEVDVVVAPSRSSRTMMLTPAAASVLVSA